MSFFSIFSSYESLWKSIIMPERFEYSMQDLGPQKFQVKNSQIQRSDITLASKYGHNLACSFFCHTQATSSLPCVIYLHASGCSRVEAMQHVNSVLSNDMNLFCFDFTACGKSGGKYSSLGFYEQEDLDSVIQYLKSTNKTNKIILWGRSMGAVTALLYSSRSTSIAGLIIDSPFADFKQLFEEQVQKKTSMPSILNSGAYEILRMTIKKNAEFDIDDLKPIKNVSKLNMPVLFGASNADDTIDSQHCKDLYAAYSGPKKLILFEGDHNSSRSFTWISEVTDHLKSFSTEKQQETKISFGAPGIKNEPYKKYNVPKGKRPSLVAPFCQTAGLLAHSSEASSGNSSLILEDSSLITVDKNPKSTILYRPNDLPRPRVMTYNGISSKNPSNLWNHDNSSIKNSGAYSTKHYLKPEDPLNQGGAPIIKYNIAIKASGMESKLKSVLQTDVVKQKKYNDYSNNVKASYKSCLDIGNDTSITEPRVIYSPKNESQSFLTSQGQRQYDIYSHRGSVGRGGIFLGL